MWVTTGEHEATRWGFRLLLEMGCCDVLQPDVGWCGGITELIRISDLADGHKAMVIPHGSSVYSYHFVVTRHNSPFAEFLMIAPAADRVVPMFNPLLLQEPVPVGVRMKVPDRPGFGVRLNPGARSVGLMSIRLLENKVIVVTGGSRGIGRAIAIESARHGADVVANYWQENDDFYDRHSAAEVGRQIELLGRRYTPVEGDISDPATSHRLVETAVAEHGRIDVLSVNAGICPFHAFLDMPLGVFEKTMRINLHGAY